jgi:hypothetical protein
MTHWRLEGTLTMSNLLLPKESHVSATSKPPEIDDDIFAPDAIADP